MKADEKSQNDSRSGSPELLRTQRSHVLFVLSEPQASQEEDFLSWYQGVYRRAVVGCVGVLNGLHYKQHQLDVTRGRYDRPPFRYLGIYGLCLDGAEQAEQLIDRITAWHQEQPAAQAPATWLYYPAVEKVGRALPADSSMLTLAFANALPGREGEFREWYATRHIRHALLVPALVGGQCYQRTQFQKPGALDAKFDTIAVYEQAGTAEALIESLVAIPKGSLSFPSLDVSRFTEWMYELL